MTTDQEITDRIKALLQWIREQGLCSGFFIPGTDYNEMISCGEGGQYCSAQCRANAKWGIVPPPSPSENRVAGNATDT